MTRGWYNDPYRHSLAARGVKSNLYLYHGTIAGRIPLIENSGGLNPSVVDRNYDDSENFIYFTTTMDDALEWAEETKEARLEGRIRRKFNIPSARWCLLHNHSMPKIDEDKIEKFRMDERHRDLDTVILRVKTLDMLGLNGELKEDEMLFGDHKYEETYTFDKPVPIDILEIWTEDGWRPLG